MAVLLLALSGCEYTITPLKGVEGRTIVYAATGEKGVPNAGIVLTSHGAVIIDPPLSPEIGARINTEALRRSKLFWDEKHRNAKSRPRTLAPPVLYVFNTTFRASHTFGNTAFADVADIITTEKAAKRQANVDDVRQMRQILKSEFQIPGMKDHYITSPHLAIEGTLTLRTPEADVKLISMGDCVGEGDGVVLLPAQKVLFAGDLVLPGFVPYYKGRTYTISNWIKALGKLQKMDVDVVVPGHGAIGGKELIQQQLVFLATLKAETQKAISQGKSETETMRLVKVPNVANWMKYDEWLPENVRIMYRELKQGEQASLKPTSGGAGAAVPTQVTGADAYREK